MLPVKTKLNRINRLKKLQQVHVQNEQQKLHASMLEREQKQNVFEQQRAQLSRVEEQVNKYFSGDNLSPVLMAGAGGLVNREHTQCQHAQEQLREAEEVMDIAISGYIDSKKNLGWLEERKEAYQKEFNLEIDKRELEQISQLRGYRGR
ncbi:hypothetical protein KIH87_12800 [Paraneptunicella aestuarii]|uniref:hypothetical protein n=1 Tax=Paraneptunicella aestuarii TaxID=2831148 RepID=UPI001E4B88E4|nr:hypothetical protein [Paraneptunicella aestuarii]UAA37588.1 hypothetical protein KIH87_12800 [Paraneptunicella aestuarii]